MDGTTGNVDTSRVVCHAAHKLDFEFIGAHGSDLSIYLMHFIHSLKRKQNKENCF